MEFDYFDTEKIYSFDSAKGENGEDQTDIIMYYDEIGFSHRWIQPPVACYFVSTTDKNGNVNLAPISMGTAMWGEPPDSAWYYSFYCPE